MQTAIATTGLRIFATCALAFVAMTAAAGTSSAGAAPEAIAPQQSQLPAPR